MNLNNKILLILFIIAEVFIDDLLYLSIFITSLLIIFLISCIVASRDAEIKDDSRIVSDEKLDPKRGPPNSRT